jgi:hypothetical protein
VNVKNKSLAAKMSTVALFLTTVMSGQAYAATQVQYSEFGLSWNKLSGVGDTKAIATSDDGSIVYAISPTYVQFSNDYGKTWSYRTNGYTNSGNVVAMSTSSDGRVVVIVENEGWIYISTNYGVSWVRRTNVNSSVNYYDPFQFPGAEGIGVWDCVSVSATGQRIIVTEGGWTYISENYGSTFSVSDARVVSIKNIAMSDDGRVILMASSTSQKLLLSDNYGSSFSAVGSLGSRDWTSVAVSGDGKYLVAGVWDADIWLSSNTGTSWISKTVSVSNKHWTWSAISNDGSRITLLRDNDVPVTSRDLGATFTERTNFPAAYGDWTGLATSSDSSRVYLAGPSGIYASVVTQTLATVTSNYGTVTLLLDICLSDTSTSTSVMAASVVLLADTASAITNSETATYIYFSETDTALWGSTYDYGSTQDAQSCAYTDLNGTLTLTRGRFMASTNSLALSETTTNTTDFIQYIGNTESSGKLSGLRCGNMNASPRNTISVTTSCTTAIQANYQQLTYLSSLQVRDSSVKKGVLGQPSGRIYTHVKVKTSAIAGAPSGTTWVATETFTVTSA